MNGLQDKFVTNFVQDSRKENEGGLQEIHRDKLVIELTGHLYKNKTCELYFKHCQT